VLRDGVSQLAVGGLFSSGYQVHRLPYGKSGYEIQVVGYQAYSRQLCVALKYRGHLRFVSGPT
jgi:hypothetical protein